MTRTPAMQVNHLRWLVVPAVTGHTLGSYSGTLVLEVACCPLGQISDDCDIFWFATANIMACVHH